MKKYTSKQLIKVYMEIVAIMLVLCTVIIFLADPFFHYHKPWFGLNAIQDSKQYQVPGAIEHLEYDSVLLGSSVSLNMNTDILDEKYDCKTIKAVGDSASAALLKHYLDEAIKRQQLKYVFYGLDVFSFYTDPELNYIPQEVRYLTNANPADDVKYLWNGEILLQRIPELVKISKSGIYDPGTAYQFNGLKECGIEAVLRSYSPDVTTLYYEQKPVNEQQEWVTENLRGIENSVKENPQTQFIFFIPPYGILWWDCAYRNGLFDTYMNTLNVSMEHLLQYDNVKIYSTDFNKAAVITDFNKYFDYLHAGTVVTDEMPYEIGDKNEEITSDNYKEEIDKFVSLFEEFENGVRRDGYAYIYGCPHL